MVDQVNTRARARSSRGYRREVAQRRTAHYPNPVREGTRVYPLWKRYRALQTIGVYQNYQMAADRIGCASNSVRRLEQCVRSYRMMGGRQRKNLCAMYQMLLSICLFIYPDAQADKICSFIIANGGVTHTW